MKRKVQYRDSAVVSVPARYKLPTTVIKFSSVNKYYITTAILDFLYAIAMNYFFIMCMYTNTRIAILKKLELIDAKIKSASKHKGNIEVLYNQGKRI